MNLLSRLTIPVFEPGTIITIEAGSQGERKAVQQLLGCVLSQCMSDRMSSIACGIRADAEPFMIYTSTGLAGMPPGRWDMVPPPARMMPKLRALALEYALFDDEGAREGLFMASLAGRGLNLALSCPDAQSFILAWGDIPGVEALFREAFGPPARIQAS